MENKELQVFTHPDFGKLEVWIGPDGKPWFPATECAKVLGYRNPRKAILDHCKPKGVTNRDSLTSGGIQQRKYINRPNLSRLISHSRLTEAEKFGEWIYEDVLEAIFEHGMYVTPDAAKRILQDPDFLIQTLQALKEEREEKERLLVETQRLDAENRKKDNVIDELQYLAGYAEEILKSTDSVPITKIAADYGMSAQELNDFLHKKHVQYKVDGQWIVYREHSREGYTESQTYIYEDRWGKKHTNMTTRWRQKGRLFINNLLNASGIYATVDKEIRKRRKKASERIAAFSERSE